VSSGRLPRRTRLGYSVGLLVLAPFLAETVASSNTPFLVFPLLLPVYAVVYGCPALVARELWARGRLGWPGLLALGAASTALNEGVVAATWFKLAPGSASVLGLSAVEAGHVAGVSWVPVTGLVVFHTVWSLALPVTLVTAWAGPRARQPWMGRLGFVACGLAVLLLALGSLTPRATTETCAGPALASCQTGRWVAFGLVVGLVVLAPLLPTRRGAPVPGLRRPGDRALVAAGASYSVLFLVAFLGLPRAGLPVAALATAIALLVIAVVLVPRWLRGPSWDLRAAVLLSAGALAPGALLTLSRPMQLQPLAGVLAGVLVWRLLRRLADRSAPHRFDGAPAAA
jgi:hypothetical protein